MDREYTIKLGGAELALIGDVLAQLPYGKVSALIAKIQGQIGPQNKAFDEADASKALNRE